MKCPKCGYLGFETTDRCRNCQYRFLARAVRRPIPTWRCRPPIAGAESTADFELPPIKRQTDSLSASALDLDRLFGDRAGARPRAPRAGERAAGVDDRRARAESRRSRSTVRTTARRRPSNSTEPVGTSRHRDREALPFDDAPIVPPPAARPPLAVRRSTPEVPRNRPRTTRPVRAELEPLQLEAEPHGARIGRRNRGRR